MEKIIVITVSLAVAVAIIIAQRHATKKAGYKPACGRNCTGTCSCCQCGNSTAKHWAVPKKSPNANV